MPLDTKAPGPWDLEEELTPERLRRFMKRHSESKALRILNQWRDTKPFFEAIKSPVGQHLLNEVIAQMEEALSLIVNEDEVKEYTRIRYHILRKILRAWTRKINLYTNSVKELKGETNVRRLAVRPGSRFPGNERATR